MTRRIMLLIAAALMAAMMVASAAPAMANDGNDRFDRGDRVGHFGVFNGFDVLDDDLDLELFDEDELFDEEDLDTIDVGDVECLVEDGDDVEFCVNEDTGRIFNNVF